MSARVEEFEHLYVALQAERALCRRLRRQITVARRMIRARIEAAAQAGARGSWHKYVELFDGLLAQLPGGTAASETLERILRGFQELQDRVERAYLEVSGTFGSVDEPDRSHVEEVIHTKEMDPKVADSEPHIPITNQLDPVTSNPSENEGPAGRAREISAEAQVETPSSNEERTNPPDLPRGVAVDVPTVMQACPEFASWARNLGGYLQDWGDVYRVAGELRPMIGVSEHAWLAAQEEMGKQKAAAALALVFDKHAAGEVASPGGYLRGMIEKAGAGELHLERSFYGRLSGQTRGAHP